MAQGVSFTSPGAGSTVSSPIHLEMSVQGMEIRPAGTAVDNHGHSCGCWCNLSQKQCRTLLTLQAIA
jgi:hypothetical protein